MKKLVLFLALTSSGFAACSSTSLGGGFTCIQNCTNFTFGATSLGCTFGSNLGTGHFIYGIAASASASTLSMGTSCGVTWSSDTASVVVGQGIHFWGTPSSGACTITLSSTTSAALQINIWEFSGGTVVDQHSFQSGGFVGSGTLVSQSMTTTANGDLTLYGLVSTSAAGGTQTANSPTILLTTSTSFGIGAGEQVQTSAGAITNSMTVGNGGNMGQGVLSLKAPATNVTANPSVFGIAIQ